VGSSQLSYARRPGGTRPREESQTLTNSQQQQSTVNAISCRAPMPDGRRQREAPRNDSRPSSEGQKRFFEVMKSVQSRSTSHVGRIGFRREARRSRSVGAITLDPDRAQATKRFPANRASCRPARPRGPPTVSVSQTAGPRHRSGRCTYRRCRPVQCPFSGSKVRWVSCTRWTRTRPPAGGDVVDVLLAHRVGRGGG
jgi:hypothetical protein